MTTLDDEFVHRALHEDATAIAHPEVAGPSGEANADGAEVGGAEREAPAPTNNVFVNVAAVVAAPDEVTHADVESTSQKKKAKESEVDDAGPAVEPARMDVLCGRGAAVNAHEGNKRFRALCFSRKPEVLAVRDRRTLRFARTHDSTYAALAIVVCFIFFSLKLVTMLSRSASPLKLSHTQ
jgi:hypothetical protein